MKIITIIFFGISLLFFATHSMQHTPGKPIPGKKHDSELSLTSPSSSPKIEGSKQADLAIKKPGSKSGCLFCCSDTPCDMVNSAID